MGVVLRQRKKTEKGKISLYLDISHNGKRWTKYLKLYLHQDTSTSKLTPKQKAENKEKLAKAEALRSKFETDIFFGEYGYSTQNKANASFIDYFESLALERKKKSEGNYGNWDSALKQLKKYTGSKKLLFSDITQNWVQGFKNFLDTEASKKNGDKLTQNTKLSYFNKLKAVLRQAVNENIITKNPADNVKTFKEPDSNREYLTIDEIRRLGRFRCESPIIKQAFLFSCLSGLRFSDFSALRWEQLEYSEEEGHYIRFTQQKTKGVVKQYLQTQAVQLLGERGEPKDKIFKSFIYSAQNNKILHKWIKEAGIIKHITFHSARHTFATLLITLDVDLYTVSKLLGHSDVKITQIYAKLIDKKKLDAVNKLPDLEIIL